MTLKMAIVNLILRSPLPCTEIRVPCSRCTYKALDGRRILQNVSTVPVLDPSVRSRSFSSHPVALQY
jgi:hypothetical protein